MSFTTQIQGVRSGASFTGSDYTNPALTNAYLAVIANLYKVASGDVPATGAGVVANIQSSMTQLINIAQNGMPITNPDGSVRTFYMTSNQATTLNSLMKSLMASGVGAVAGPLATFDPSTITAAQLTQWSSDNVAGLSNPVANNPSLSNLFLNVLTSMAGAAFATPSNQAAAIDRLLGTNSIGAPVASNSSQVGIQSYTELAYIQTANAQITQMLSSLQQNLTTTSSTIQVLTALQTIHNNLAVTSRTYNYNLLPIGVLSVGNAQSQYQNSASTQLGTSLIPQLSTEFNPFLMPNATISVTNVTRTNVFVTFPPSSRPAIDSVTVTATIPTGYNASAVPPTPSLYYQVNQVTGAVTPITSSTISFSYTRSLSGGAAIDSFTESIYSAMTALSNRGDVGLNDYLQLPEALALSTPTLAVNFFLNLLPIIISQGQTNPAGLAGAFNGIVLPALRDAWGANVTNFGTGNAQMPLLGTVTGMQGYLTQLLGAQSTLLNQLALLSSQTPASTMLNPILRSQSLFGLSQTVYNDLTKNLITSNGQAITGTTTTMSAISGVRAWLMDNYQTFSSPAASQAGIVQQNLTNALTAGSATNSTQTQKVQNSLFLFQQYYQSASAVLTALTQAITSMARRIAQ